MSTRQLEKRFSEDLLKNSAVATFVLDARHRVLMWNRACEKLTGVPASAMLGTDGQWRPFYAERRPVLADVALGGVAVDPSSMYTVHSPSVLLPEGLHAEGWYKNLNGRDRYLVFDAAPIADADGRIIAAIETIQDFTGRKRAEEETFLAKQDWEHTFNSITDMVTVHDRDYNVILANKAAEKILGLPLLDPTTLRKCFKYYHGGDAPPLECPSCKCLETGVADSFERYEPHLNMYIEIRAIPRFDSGGRLIGLIHVVRDITERKKSQDAIERYGKELEEKVRERTKALEDANLELHVVNQELVLRREEAESASRSKTDFLATMSHELRTPLNAIMGFTDIITMGMAGPVTTKQKEFLGDIMTSAAHLLSLINDILDLSKVEAGKMELELSEFGLKELFEGSIMMFKEKALKHRIAMSLAMDAPAARVTADRRKLKQVLVNLLGNAMKFTPDGGAVRLSARCARGADLPGGAAFLEISVADTGIGISAGQLERLFRPFQQVETSLTRKYLGSGLGLSLCRRFVELHGGRIWVESEEGRGSVFTFTIPSRARSGEAS